MNASSMKNALGSSSEKLRNMVTTSKSSMFDKPKKAFIIVLIISCSLSLIGLGILISQKKKKPCERKSAVIIIGVLFAALGAAFIILTLALIAISSYMN